ncbi:MAG: TolC family protein, partial [Ignavibacteriae bacterium]|nr:TolC family protein [Ignavibacteriota bacterium]
MIKKYILFITSFLLVSGNCFSQEPLSLSDAINIGLENNYNIRIAKKDLEVSSENNSWSNVGRFPTIDVGVTSVNRFDNTETADIKTNNLVPSAQLNWTLFNGFKIFNNKKKLDDIYNLTKGNVAVVVENNIESIILSYYNVLLQKEKLNVFTEVEKLSKDRYDRALMSREIGSSITYEVLQAKNSWLEDRSTQLSQKLNVDNSIRALNLLIGETSDKSYDFVDDFKAETNDYLLEDLKNKMFESNKTLKNQYFNQLISERNVDIAGGDFYPTLRLNSGYDYESSNQQINSLPRTNSKAYDYYANVTLSWNIFNGLNSRRALEVAKIESEISKIEADQI